MVIIYLTLLIYIIFYLLQIKKSDEDNQQEPDPEPAPNKQKIEEETPFKTIDEPSTSKIPSKPVKRPLEDPGIKKSI